jgi:3-demethoxyubiquinol 3-hydroxylase
MPTIDAWIAAGDEALRCLAAPARASRAAPQSACTAPALDDTERQHAAGLMRVNHVGEVCAQALYSAQALFSASLNTKSELEHAAQEEQDHLAWTADRVRQLGSHTSVLNPLWYAGAFAIGAMAARISDGVSLGFVVETERQVAQHLQSHLAKLPQGDVQSAAIVAQMKADEERHGAHAKSLGATELPSWSKEAMQAAAKVMTTIAYRI